MKSLSQLEGALRMAGKPMALSNGVDGRDGAHPDIDAVNTSQD
jgi:hypothetical protein